MDDDNLEVVTTTGDLLAIAAVLAVSFAVLAFAIAFLMV